MDNIKQRSLADLESLYYGKLQHWKQQRLGHLKKAEECEQQMSVCEQKLRHIKALVNGPQALTAQPVKETIVKRSRKRTRKSPIRDATLLVLRNRPSQRLTAAQIRTLIRKDTNRRSTRQSVNVNLGRLEDAGLVKRAKAPKGSGAQFVYWAV